jgi:hypothetical protein
LGREADPPDEARELLRFIEQARPFSGRPFALLEMRLRVLRCSLPVFSFENVHIDRK